MMIPTPGVQKKTPRGYGIRKPQLGTRVCRTPLFLALLILGAAISFGAPPVQDNTAEHESTNTRLLPWVAGAHAVAYTGTMLLLDQMWYREHPRSSFHFHDDSRHWMQMDKLGHTTTAYHFSRFSYYSFRAAGLSNHSGALWGSISGSLFLTTIEILDGFSQQWGASWSDLAANTLGSLSFYLQQRCWQEQRILWKYSFRPSGLEQYRPDLLGSNLGENLIKDYNGQTYWLSLNLKALLTMDTPFPSWLNLAIGHGAHGMLGSLTNPTHHQGIPLPAIARSRSLYLAPDIDFARIPSQSPMLRGLLHTLNFIKFPAPALEYNTLYGWQLHWVFF